jgi:serine/threonine protein kinase
MFKHEILSLRKLDHPCIIRAIESYDSPEAGYMVMEHCRGRELYDVIVDAPNKILPHRMAAHLLR